MIGLPPGKHLAILLTLGLPMAYVRAQEAPAEAVPDQTRPESPPSPLPASIPSDQQLQASGAHIGRIDIKVVDVFDTDNPKDNKALYRAANFLHINTREDTVRPQLLFKPGAVYSRHLLDETERNLRARRYLEDATIVPIGYDPATNTVDVLVRVHDVWTLTPGVSYGRSGGENSSGFQLDESNLLGYGKRIGIDYSNDVDRSGWKLGYGDTNLFGSRWELATNVSDTSDGNLYRLAIEHPFYSLDTHWSAGFNGSQEERVDKRFAQNVQVDQYQVRATNIGIQGGWSSGLHREASVPWLQRWTLGYRVDEQRFNPDPVLGTLMLPQDKLLRYPWIGFSWFQDLYEKTRNRDRIERTEDLYIGRSLSISVGYASKTTGADRNATLVTLGYKDTYRLSERQRIFGEFSASGRRQNDQWQGTVLSGLLRYDLRQTSKSMLVIKLSHATTVNPDDSQQLILGSEEGLRGYPLRYRSAKQRSVLVVEERAYTDIQILRLLSVGGAAFVDVGHVGGEYDPLPEAKSTFTDVGMGLRFGNIRSSSGDMFHLDVAYPIDATGKDRKLQFSVTTLQTF